jgi:hypothetical protein
MRRMLLVAYNTTLQYSFFLYPLFSLTKPIINLQKNIIINNLLNKYTSMLIKLIQINNS